MFYSFRKIYFLAFIFLTSIIFIGSNQNANAIGISISIYIGKGGECTGRGICKIVIGAELRTAASSSDNVVTLKAEAVLKGNKLVVTFQDKLDERMMSENGKYVLTIGEDAPSFEVSKDENGQEVLTAPSNTGTARVKTADKSTPKLYTVVPGNYEIKGNTLTLKTKTGHVTLMK